MLNRKQMEGGGEHWEPAAQSNENVLRKTAHKESLSNHIFHNASSETTHDHESGLVLLTRHTIGRTRRTGQDAANAALSRCGGLRNRHH